MDLRIAKLYGKPVGIHDADAKWEIRIERLTDNLSIEGTTERNFEARPDLDVPIQLEVRVHRQLIVICLPQILATTLSPEK